MNCGLLCVIVLLGAVELVASQTSSSTVRPRVKTSGGTLAGKRIGSVNEWQSIRYAQAPVGDLRFAPPQEFVSDDLFGAGRRMPACMQNEAIYEPMSEDCLFLSVYGPASATSSSRLPVFVWIHGGAFESQTAKAYNGTHFAESGMVFVAINYRLGWFGFLPLAEHLKKYGTTGGANGLLDQIMGLKWVQKNIEQFGGDPQQVTLAGDSAGGVSACILMGSPAAKGLFNRALIMSGACNGPWGPMGMTFQYMQRRISTQILQQHVGATTLAALRQVDASKFIAAQRQIELKLFPSIDNLVITSASKNFNINHATDGVIIGNTNMDGLIPFYLPEFLGDKIVLRGKLSLLGLFESRKIVNTYEPILKEMQTDGDDRIRNIFTLMNGDACLGCPTNDLVDLLSAKFPKLPTFTYQYNKNTGGTVYEGKFALHAADMTYLFPQLHSKWKQIEAPQGPWARDDPDFQKVYFGLITGFAKGAPTNDPHNWARIWPSNTASRKYHLVFEDDRTGTVSPSKGRLSVVRGHARQTQCEAWRKNLWTADAQERQWDFCWVNEVIFPGRYRNEYSSKFTPGPPVDVSGAPQISAAGQGWYLAGLLYLSTFMLMA